MGTYPKPENEGDRLNSLRSLKILDTDPEERFDRYTRLCTKLFNVPIALVSLVDSERQWFKSRQGLASQETERRSSFCTRVVLDGAPLVIDDTFEDSRFSECPLVAQPPNVRFYAGYPLFHNDGACLGTLCLMDHQPRAFTDPDLEALHDMATMVERELSAIHLATTCELTHMSNRRGFISLAYQAFSVCVREQIPLSIVFFDLNKFKAINDTYGHAEGDLALKAFSELLKDSFRDSDLVARLGGDEFVALLTSTNASQAQDAVDRFQISVSEYNASSGKDYDLEFSEGAVSVIPDSEDQLEELLARADDLMYQNKKAKA
ncbi:diguanylate cyclase domain-containing protein [Litoribrevibacter euphylliae]|uniref:Diguanylate cyclase domain-containing protein n=1 Tax=Litoribrevibacter euphylliae TaxID=1834034 RepID=A0ABV7HP32_9GAMM